MVPELQDLVADDGLDEGGLRRGGTLRMDMPPARTKKPSRGREVGDSSGPGHAGTLVFPAGAWQASPDLGVEGSDETWCYRR